MYSAQRVEPVVINFARREETGVIPKDKVSSPLRFTSSRADSEGMYYVLSYRNTLAL